MRQIDVIKIYSKKRSLIVDDYPEVRGEIKRMLKAFGATSIDTAATGEEVIALCQNHQYDLVLCDYNLGLGKDGQQILEELRHLRILTHTSLFVIITAETSRQMVLGALESQPDEYITKPITHASLRNRLDKALLKHEALFKIKQAIDQRSYEKAIELCDYNIQAGKKYTLDCLKLKAQLHFQLGQHEQSKTIYKKILSSKPVHWANLGLGKAQLALQEYEQAENTLKSVIDEDYRYIEAYDLLTQLYEETNQLNQALIYTQKATEISPKSVIRQRNLAKIAEKNKNDQLCLQAHHNTIKWAYRSCYESAQDYFNFIRKITAVITENPQQEKADLLKKAYGLLERVRKNYNRDTSVNIQSKWIESQLCLCQGQTENAQTLITEAETKTQQSIKDNLPVSPYTLLEQARTMITQGKQRDAAVLLQDLASKNLDNTELLELIDELSEEPVSKGGKKLAGKLTQQGIQLYESQQYTQSIELFKKAVSIFPKHAGLNLNLLQVILAEAKKSENLNQYHDIYNDCLCHIEYIDETHPQYTRYQFLTRELEKLDQAQSDFW